jgi:preprotein translocase subunit SecD
MSKSMALPSAIAVLLGFSESVLPEMGRVDASQDAPVIQFRIAQDSAGPNFIKMEGPSGSVYVAAQSFLSDTDIQHATASILTEYLVIKIQFTPTGISVLKRATRERIGSRLALLVDSRVIADGVIRSELGTSITVGLKLADLPQTGALTALDDGKAGEAELRYTLDL